MESPSRETPNSGADEQSYCSSHHTDADNPNNRSQIAEEVKRELLGENKKEQRTIAGIRLFTVLVLLAASLAFSLAVYYISDRAEIRDFETEFDNRAAQVIASFGDKAVSRILALSAFSFDMVSFARATNMEWPMVTLPDFEQRGRQTMELASLISILVCPIVTNGTRDAYEEHSRENQGWLADGLAQQEFNRNASWSRPDNWTAQVGALPPTIINLSGGYNLGPEPWTPTWQVAPAIPLPVIANFNLIEHSKYTDVMKAAIETGEITISRTFVPFNESDAEDSSKTTALRLYMERWEEYGGAYEYDPVSDLVFPVFAEKNGKTEIVALLKCFVYWRSYFVHLLPEGAGSMLAVIENTCGDVFSYEILGPDVIYLGQGSQLNEKFQHMKAEATFRDLSAAGVNAGILFTDQKESSGNCLYRLRVHPTEAFEAEFRTVKPTIYAVVVSLVFVLTSMIFVIYDRLVQRRQRRVIAAAVWSGTIVSSLFPKNVRNRMLDTSNDAPASVATVSSGRQRMKNFVSSEKDKVAASSAEECDPIADEFENCTVLFADIKGFTSWSSSRPPADVFRLLEAVYGAFDKSAFRQGVFKVETIGDCYLAVAGLPEPQENHAKIIAVFALGLVRKMGQITKKMASQLGSETQELEIRCGLHSGKVTAGVLRGEKSRFQLFGDTVNTASRMESTGEGGNVQVSETTQQALVQSGYNGPIIEREDKVIVKGKGEMKTFWLIDKTNRLKAYERLESHSSSGVTIDWEHP